MTRIRAESDERSESVEALRPLETKPARRRVSGCPGRFPQLAHPRGMILFHATLGNSRSTVSARRSQQVLWLSISTLPKTELVGEGLQTKASIKVLCANSRICFPKQKRSERIV